MADRESLTHTFMRDHPPEAARALEAVPPAGVAALLVRTPVRLGAPVLAAMLPATAVRTLEALADERAMELLGALPVQPAALLLRQVGEPRRARLIAGMPTASAVASVVLLGYPADSAGAWANPQVVALPPAATAGEALERARRGQDDVAQVFVVESDQRLIGRVGLPELVRAADTVALESLMSRPGDVVAAQTTLEGALAHPGWLRHSALPVVESGDRLLGVLTRDALARAVGSRQRERAGAASRVFTGGLAHGWWSAISGGLAAAIALLPSVPPVAGGGDGR